MFLKTTIALLSTLTLSACAIIYHQPVQQGNILSPTDIRSVHVGSSERTLLARFGAPVMKNIFSNNEKIYVYYFKNRRNKVTSYWLKVYISRGRVVRFERSSFQPRMNRT
jgi:outer membrane protein assembly factor BamE (lipoprotein component of BamABCDE complex)